MVGKQLKQLATIEPPDPEDSDEEEDDDEEILGKATLVLYRLIYLRVTHESQEPAAIKVDTQQCIADFLHLITEVEAVETRELLIEAIRHSFAFLVGPQLINVGECKSLIFGMLPGLADPWPLVGAHTNPSKPIVTALQILFNAIPHAEGETLTVNGVFDKKTAARVRALQKDQCVIARSPSLCCRGTPLCLPLVVSY